ncbi:hypothetical protein CRM94_17465 [Burkholderia gladioli]|uniref:Uncharacterized protein n=1 Tax=Burkholderia gladioli TaxID=28095 RepID=A0A2A7SAD4_BURGA|nr:hypothetical protein [Burkholderia gladioli]PEH40498.1 hypothetical protein CRM94_17465 [Burkholderia gladioli]
MKLLILPTISDDPSNVRYIVADDALLDPELLLQQVIATVASANRNYGWAELEQGLRASGFEVPDAFLADQPWDVAADPSWGTNFTIEFPADAPHEYAGQRGVATNSASGMLQIVLRDNTVLTPWDQPYRRGAEGQDQIALGPLIVPRTQFAVGDADGLELALKLLKEAGYECVA